MNDSDPIIVGRINGFYGVQGWVKIYSHTRPIDNILNYSPWLVRIDNQWQSVVLKAGRRQAKGLIAHLEGFDERNAVQSLLNADIAITRAQLPNTANDEYYWSDLVGLQVINLQEQVLGIVTGLLETGAHDVLKVQAEVEILIPFVPDIFIKSVDLEQKQIVVDWNEDF